ncbi:MAG: ABC transporter ATP-binding protein [Alphaproteobacteria bacterium]|nr:ABC transporter ATP-binding protein [Alphaproteobacteria bacterium]
MLETKYAIQTNNLYKYFDDVAAVDGINLTVNDGSITGLLGGNGAGKTTTMAMLIGLMLPSSGSITVLDTDMLNDRFAALPFMNFSSPYVDLPGKLTVRMNLSTYGDLYGISHKKARIAELADELQLVEFLDREHGSLSAGQKTRASLAKALLNKPQLLLLDEPTASLDPDTADWMRGLLVKYRKDTGATIFMASHNMVEVERICDDVIIMQRGRIVDRGSPQNLIDSYGRNTLEEVFLDIARDKSAYN